VEEVYGGKVDRDFLTAGVLLNDIFKPVIYTMDENGELSYLGYQTTWIMFLWRRRSLFEEISPFNQST
jgi:hypothetical protein